MAGPRRPVPGGPFRIARTVNAPIVCLDCETATLRGAPHLLELGAVRVVEGEVTDTFERLVRPEVAIEPAATEIHGIADEHVRDARSAPQVLADFAAWLGGDWMAAHNASFDARVLGFEFRRARLEAPAQPEIGRASCRERVLRLV